MSDPHRAHQEQSVYRWGGLAGILGGVLFILSGVVAEGMIPPAPADPLELVARFPDVHMLRVAENSLYLLGLVAGFPLLLSLFWALRETSLAPALFGSAIGIVGLISMVVSATPHVAHHPISEQFQAAGATPEAQATLGLMWDATWGMFDAPLYVGFLVGMIGITLIGVALFSSPEFGKGLGWMTVALGAVGAVAALLQMVNPASNIGAVPFLGYVLFYFVLGRKMYGLSKVA